MPNVPNVLLITSDQHHHRALGKHIPALQTPALDRIADEGTLFGRAYCNNPVCSPSRSTILTGQYPSVHGCWTIGVQLDERTVTLGHLLGAAGFVTSLVGKAHFQPLASTPDQHSLEDEETVRDLEFWRRFHGPYYGFDHIELARNHSDESHVGEHYALWMEEKGLTNWRDYFQPWPPEPNAIERHHAWDLPLEMHYSRWTAERSIAAIERGVAAERPFFHWASFQDPHPPYLVPEPYASMYDPWVVEIGTLAPGELDRMAPWFRETQAAQPDFSRWQETPHANHGFISHTTPEDRLRRDIATYYGMLSLLDDQIATILTRLDQLGVADNTIVIFTTDHGHFLGQHGLVAKGPFHYEDMLRIPFLVRWPGVVPSARRTDALTSLVDLAPTLLNAIGLPVPLWMQGVDQGPVWRDEAPSATDHVIVENRHQPTAVHLRTYIESRYKLTIYRGETHGELFDLEADPLEQHNRFDDPEYAGIKAQLAMRFLDAELKREPMTRPRIAVA